MLRLPKNANAILSRCETEDAQRLAMRRANAARVRELRELRERRGECQQRLAIALRDGPLQRPRPKFDETGAQVGTDFVADDSNARVEREEIEAIDRQIAQLTATDRAPHMTATRLRNELDQHAKYVGASVTPKLKANETAPKALARARGTINAKREERKAVSKASRTCDEVHAAAMSQIRAMVARGLPDPRPAFRGGEIVWPRASVPNSGSAAYAFVPDAALWAWVFEEQLTKKVTALLEANRPDDALSEAEQAARLEVIDAELESLFREEGALVESIVAEGGNAFHYADRPATAVLGIRLA